jgi:hypothetical protein
MTELRSPSTNLPAMEEKGDEWGKLMWRRWAASACGGGPLVAARAFNGGGDVVVGELARGGGNYWPSRDAEVACSRRWAGEELVAAGAASAAATRRTGSKLPAEMGSTSPAQMRKPGRRRA